LLEEPLDLEALGLSLHTWASEGGPWPPVDFEIISKKGYFFKFEGLKLNFTIFGSPWKKWENPLLPPPGKNPSDIAYC